MRPPGKPDDGLHHVALEQVRTGAGSRRRKRKVIGQGRGRPENNGETACGHTHRHIANAVQDGDRVAIFTGPVGDLRDNDIGVTRLIRQCRPDADVHVGDRDVVHGQPPPHQPGQNRVGLGSGEHRRAVGPEHARDRRQQVTGACGGIGHDERVGPPGEFAGTGQSAISRARAGDTALADSAPTLNRFRAAMILSNA